MLTPKKYDYQGQLMTMADIARETGQPAARIRMRLNRGWSMEDAVSKARMPPQVSGRMGKRRSSWAKSFSD